MMKVLNHFETSITDILSFLRDMVIRQCQAKNQGGPEKNCNGSGCNATKKLLPIGAQCQQLQKQPGQCSPQHIHSQPRKTRMFIYPGTSFLLSEILTNFCMMVLTPILSKTRNLLNWQTLIFLPKSMTMECVWTSQNGISKILVSCRKLGISFYVALFRWPQIPVSSLLHLSPLSKSMKFLSMACMLSLVFNGHSPGVVFSVYLSRPVHAGRSYNKTKFRFMGCFKPTQFIQLTDTPDAYTGQAGKFVAVKDTENGLEFVEAGGGGVTCDDVCECSCIQAIKDEVDNIGEIVSLYLNTSIPPVNLGLLYNEFVCASLDPISSSNDWRFLTHNEWYSMYTYLGGSSIAGGILKETGLAFWASPNVGASNSKGFTMRGTGLRSYYNGNFSSLYIHGYFWLKNAVAPGYYAARFYANSASTNNTSTHETDGLSIRLFKEAPGVADGVQTVYFGNDGKIYRAICINEFYCLVDSLAESKFRSGTLIPEITDNATWAALTTPALCAFNNDWNNV